LDSIHLVILESCNFATFQNDETYTTKFFARFVNIVNTWLVSD